MFIKPFQMASLEKTYIELCINCENFKKPIRIAFQCEKRQANFQVNYEPSFLLDENPLFPIMS